MLYYEQDYPCYDERAAYRFGAPRVFFIVIQLREVLLGRFEPLFQPIIELLQLFLE